MDNQRESLVTIPGFSKYSVTKTGRIYSHRVKRFMSPAVNKSGYMATVLTNDSGETKNIMVHRMVALAHLPNPDNLPVVHHKDDCKTNNNLENLEWCTISHNISEDYRLKGDKRPQGRKNQHSDFRDIHREEVMELWVQGYTTRKIAEMVGMNRTTVGRIVQDSSTTRETSRFKLTTEDIVKIFNSELPHEQLAKEHGVQKSHVANIKKGKAYKGILKELGLLS